QGHERMVLTRNPGNKTPGPGVVLVEGDSTKAGPWQDQAATAQAAINLAGDSIFQKWTPETKQRILDSRILTTRHLVAALAGRTELQRVLLSTSAVGYYGFHGDEELDETAEAGSDFLATVAQAWETEAQAAEKNGIRVCRMRFGVVLAAGGGALGIMLPMFQKGLGGRLGHGRQWFSWIHRSDLIRAIDFLLSRPEVSGPFNFTSPGAVTNANLAHALGKALKRPAILPAPGFTLKLILGEFSKLLLEGQKVIPKKLLSMGFKFDFPDLDGA
ncbi:MAG: TIGR01777 family protein, partial [Deltaproteobacteria bacterium]|nr:TIGR01777 family protein [Deltaproteobacteria bacterium]